MLQGKGVFIWQVQNCEDGDAGRIVQVAQAAGLQHVAVKVADGRYSFPDQPYEAMTAAAIQALKAAGITVWGWQFVYGRNRNQPSERIALAEAQVAAQRVQAFDLGGFIIDFELNPSSPWTYYGDAQDALTYMLHLRASLPGVLLAGCSHRFPHLQWALPWEEFMGHCDVAMPQVYWVLGEPASQLRASRDEYRSLWPHLPYVPVGAAYAEGGWSASPDEVTAFLTEAHALDLPAVSFWSWEHARNHPQNPWWPGTELWDAIATFDWDTGSGGQPAERAVWVTASSGLKFRSQPSTDDAHWIDHIVFAQGAPLTAVGSPTAPGAHGYRWQAVRTPDGREGWVAYGSSGEVYLTEYRMFAPPPAWSEERQVRVTASLGLKFRSQTLLDDAYWIDRIVFPLRTHLTAVGDPTAADARGYRWQYVRTGDGRVGWVAFSIDDEVYLEDRADATFFPPPPDGSPERTVQVTASLGLKFRSQTSTDDAYWIDNLVFATGTMLTAIGNPTTMDTFTYRWQYVRAPDGRVGWVAFSIGQEIYLRDMVQESVLTVWSTDYLNVRDAPSIQGERLWTVADDVPLTVLEDPAAAGSKVGLAGQWIQVRTPSLKEGYVAADYVRAGQSTDPRPPAERVPPGESAYIYGFHDAYDRGLFAGSDAKGWVLFTEELGANPGAVGGRRGEYYTWSRAGFGVLSRLNYGYHGAGTVPPAALHDAFVQTCASWVQRSQDDLDPQHGCHIWIVGNEMNNPREWPGNQDGVGGTPITPESYAALFNRTYDAIKAVQPGAVVCPGAVDPYNAVAGDPGEWFRRMLSNIDALDGIVLHAYTHGPQPALVTSTALFGDPPLTWQYYNFYAYRTFMDLIPGRWREVPVFITETDQVDSWANTNNGWVRAAYAEIDRWNQSPHHQQIRCLLLYRWWSIDKWGIEHKPGVKEDFQQALPAGYRWRASVREVPHVEFGFSMATPRAAGPVRSPREDLALPEPDDLQSLWSIGPKTEAALRAAGVYSFAQLAELSVAQIKERLAAVGARGRYIASWPRQAALAAKDDAAGLRELQETLKG